MLKKSTVLILLIAISTQVFAQSGMPQDVVSTLKTDMVIHSRGQLGGIAVDALGYIYMANFLDGLWKISPEGKTELLTNGLYGSSGITIDKMGNIYQANFLNHSISKINRFGEVSTYVSDGLNGPVGMVFDQEGSLIVCNCPGNFISKTDKDGTTEIIAEGEMFNCPNSITQDKNGDLFVANFGDDLIIRIDQNYEPTVFTTVRGAEGSAHLAYYNDNFYLTKIKDSKLYKISPNGDYTLVAGSNYQNMVDGVASEASLMHPNGIAVNTVTGDIYINNLKGTWQRKDTLSEVIIRKVAMASFADKLKYQIDNEGLEAAEAFFKSYNEDPKTSHEDLGPQTGTLAWSYLSQRNATAALALFNLMAEAYPERWRPFYYLGDVYKIIGQNDEAIKHYKKALTNDPDNTTILGKLKQLEE
ncbi:MAG: tetratricopeptide repeat protein [Cyclobacteriaceae bacterium]